MSSSFTSSEAVPKARRGLAEIIRSYVYWNYRRGSFHYDVMVTLILLFIFVAPRFWDFGGRPTPVSNVSHPIQVSSDGTRGLIVRVAAADVKVKAGASDSEVRKALRKAMEPVTGDAVFVERWITVSDSQGNLEWQVWAHR